MQRLKENHQHHVIRIGLVSLSLLVLSCRTSDVTIYNDNKTYKAINTLLDFYFVENKPAYLHPEIIAKQSYIIRDFTTERGYYYNCDKSVVQNAFIEEDFDRYKNQENQVGEWNYNFIKHPKVITTLELKSPLLIKRFEAHKNSARDKFDLLDRKYMIWTGENNGNMIKLSLPFFSKNGLYASIFMSKTYHGTYLWILEKKNKKWEVICNMELSVY